jgi:hypothetical protein
MRDALAAHEAQRADANARRVYFEVAGDTSTCINGHRLPLVQWGTRYTEGTVRFNDHLNAGEIPVKPSAGPMIRVR